MGLHWVAGDEAFLMPVWAFYRLDPRLPDLSLSAKKFRKYREYIVRILERSFLRDVLLGQKTCREFSNGVCLLSRASL